MDSDKCWMKKTELAAIHNALANVVQDYQKILLTDEQKQRRDILSFLCERIREAVNKNGA